MHCLSTFETNIYVHFVLGRHLTLLALE